MKVEIQDATPPSLSDPTIPVESSSNEAITRHRRQDSRNTREIRVAVRNLRRLRTIWSEVAIGTRARWPVPRDRGCD
jgi:hypothetical protein